MVLTSRSSFAPPIYTVIGNPIEHSLSPRIQTMFAKAAGIQIEYSRTLAPLDGFKACINALMASGLRGANVTRPFKFEALQMATQATPRAQLAGAANTLRFAHIDGAMTCWADNTDGIGLVRDITHNAGVALAGQKILLIGSGGAAAGVLALLIESKPMRVVVANRTLKNAQELVTQHTQLALQKDVELIATELNACGDAFHVVINSSASSQDGQPIPVSAKTLKAGALAVDMAYGAEAKPFMQWAAAHGAHGRDGLGMLVEQAAASFYSWHNVRPNGAAVLQELQQALYK